MDYAVLCQNGHMLDHNLGTIYNHLQASGIILV